MKPAKKFTAELYVLTKEEGGRHTPFFKNYRPQFFIRTADVTGTVILPEVCPCPSLEVWSSDVTAAVRSMQRSAVGCARGMCTWAPDERTTGQKASEEGAHLCHFVRKALHICAHVRTDVHVCRCDR